MREIDLPYHKNVVAMAKAKARMDGVIERFENGEDKDIFESDDAGTYAAYIAECRHLLKQAFGEGEFLPPFMERVVSWLHECFGEEISLDKLERSDRFAEEVIELLQSGGYPKERLLALLSHHYSKPAGEPSQEVGGVMITLAGYCYAHGIDMHKCAEDELRRVWEKTDQIRAKQKAKPKGSAIPVPVRESGEGVDIDATIAKLETLIPSVTRGPWQSSETKHPFAFKERVVMGETLPRREGYHTERTIHTVHSHPQLKAPEPVVTSKIGIGTPESGPITMVAMRDEDAEYIAAVNPVTVQALIDEIKRLRNQVQR